MRERSAQRWYDACMMRRLTMRFPLLRLHLHLHPRRLLVAPRVEVGADGALRVHGMACAICAGRARAALTAVPGVEAAAVDLEAGTAWLHLAPGAWPDREVLQAALDRVVLGGRVRRWLERAARRGTRGRA